MNDISQDNIEKILRVVREYFPYTHIIDVFKNLTGYPDLKNFQHIKEFYDNNTNRTSGVKITKKVITEMSEYFTEDPNSFITFLASLSSQGIKHKILTTISLDDFITKINSILRTIDIAIEKDGRILKWVPNKEKKNIFLDIEVPERICDYFSEGLDCSYLSLYRSSILFCTFSLEASLRYKYTEIENKNSKRKTFSNLIDWGIKNKLIFEDKFNEMNINFLRDYRNDLAHCNFNNLTTKLKISREYAKKMCNVVIHLVELFVNDMFSK